MNCVKKIQLIFLVPIFVACNSSETQSLTEHGAEVSANSTDSSNKTISNIEIPKPLDEPKLDTLDYQRRLEQLSNGDTTGTLKKWAFWACQSACSDRILGLCICRTCRS